jgi:hypothetical protein
MDEYMTPDSVLSKTDVGDDTQRRFRYQATYAAILSLNLLREESEFEEIFCEHHEDILIKLKDGTFRGVQVKTRKEGLEPFKASDSEIRKALKKFIELEKEFLGHFSRFVLAANCGFWYKKKNGSNLPYILELARNTKNSKTTSLKHPLSSYIKKFTNITGINEDFVLNVLKKIKIQGSLPKFEGIELSLINEIARIPGMDTETFVDLQGAAKELTNTMFRAASLSHDSPVECYFALHADPERERTDAIIEGKRITEDTIQRILQQSITSKTLLRTWDPVSLPELPKGMRTMVRKMTTGGISVSNINLFKDYKYSAGVLFSEWIHKYSRKKATERYEHLRTIVLTECQEAYDSTKDDDEPFGEKMLSDVRRRLRDRHSNEKNSLFGCHYEHLLGIAGTLTEDCPVKWSRVFDTPEVVS